VQTIEEELKESREKNKGTGKRWPNRKLRNRLAKVIESRKKIDWNGFL
jgi:hypothetical protein